MHPRTSISIQNNISTNTAYRADLNILLKRQDSSSNLQRNNIQKIIIYAIVIVVILII